MSALAASDVGTLRRIHLGMIDAVLAGGGVEPVAALAAERLGGTVAIVLPAVDVSIGPPRFAAYVADRLGGRPVRVPPGVVAEVPVRSGDELLGYVALLDAPPAIDASEVLELAAVAAVTAVTLRDANVSRRRAAAALFDDLRAGEDIVARARRLGADLSRGASALSARGPAERVLAAIAQEVPGALAAPRGDRVEALLPGDPAAARRLARRLKTSGLSPFSTDLARRAALRGARARGRRRGFAVVAAADRRERRAAAGAGRRDGRPGRRACWTRCGPISTTGRT